MMDNEKRIQRMKLHESRMEARRQKFAEIRGQAKARQIERNEKRKGGGNGRTKD